MDKFLINTARLLFIKKKLKLITNTKNVWRVIVSSFIFCSRRKVCEKHERKIPRPGGRQEDD